MISSAHASSKAGPAMGPAAAVCLVLLLALALGACDRSEPVAGSASDAAPRDAAAAAQSGGGALVLPEPPAGQVFAVVRDGLVSVRAHQARRIDVLDAIADAAGFTLVTGRIEPIPPIDYEASGRPVEEVLRELLAGVRYELAYAVPASDAAAGAPPPPHVLETVTVGRFESKSGRAQRTRLARMRARTGGKLAQRRPARKPRRQLSPEELEQRREEARALHESAVATLASDAPPEARLEAVDWLEAEGDDLRVLARVASEDPDPRVRMAAVERLGDGDSVLAVNALLRSLADPDPQVVVTALDSLTFAGDESVVPDLKPLLEHPDPRVREAAAETIEFLE